MSSNEYIKLINQARRKHLQNIKDVSSQLERLYKDAAKDLSDKAAKSGKGTISERWAAEYSKSLRERAQELHDGIYDITMQGLKNSASYPTDAQTEFFESRTGMSFRDAFAKTPDAVLAEIIGGGFYKDKKGLSERIWGTAKGLEKDVDYIIQKGIAEHKSAVNLAKDLESYVDPKARKSWDWGKVYPNLAGKRVDYNAQRLARTSINHAYYLSNVKSCQNNPYITYMHWELSDSHYERQVKPFGEDVCDEYAKHDDGHGKGNWPADKLPTPHPQCLCVQWGILDKSLKEIGEELGEWAAGKPNGMLDKWYEGLKNNNGNSIMKNINLDPLPITTASLNNIKTFSSDILSKQLQLKLQNEHKKLLLSVLNKPLGTEAGATYTLSMSLISKVMGKDGGSSVNIPHESVPYIAMHNHPTGTTFTHTDLRQFVKDENLKMLTAVGNNGNIYAVEKTDLFSYTKWNLYFENILKKHPDFMNSPESYMNFVNDLLEGADKNGIKYYANTSGT